MIYQQGKKKKAVSLWLMGRGECPKCGCRDLRSILLDGASVLECFKCGHRDHHFPIKETGSTLITRNYVIL